MANQDRVNFVWAETALTTIPPIPVSEVAYRDTTQTPEQMEVGQQYDTIYNSARHNQLLFLLTSVAKTLCENGIMPFLAGQEYSQYARCIFTDGKLYTASRAILANEQPYPTPGDDSGVWTTEETGENLVPDSRRVIAGTGLTGGGPLSSDVTLAAKLTNSVSLTDSTTAASATAVKTAYDLAKSKQPNLGFTPVQQGGGTGHAFLPAAQFQLPPKIQPKHATRHPTGKLYKLQPPRRFFLHLASYCVFDMINITFTCRITCKQVNKDCFFKIPVLRLSYFYKGKSSNICNSVMILYYPYVTLSKQLPYATFCPTTQQAPQRIPSR